LRIVHVISGLGVGGAERMLQRLCEEHARQGLAEPVVVSLTTLGPIGERLRTAGIRVETLGMAGLGGTPGAVARLRALLAELKPDLVQSWLYHADLIAGLALRKGWRAPLAWNLRCTVSGDNLATRALVRINALLSRRLPTSIVCCGEEAARFHAARGYDAARMTVLPNGFEVDHFAPPVRREDTAGCRFLAIGRDDVLKDYPTLIRAFAQVARDVPEVSLTICGKGIAESAQNRELVRSLGLDGRVTLGPPLADVREALGRADVYCSSSTNEGFPNVIGEAMLMALPVVATDAGDTAIIVGPCGTVVPTRNPDALGAAMRNLALMAPAARRAMGRKARERIASRYEIGHVARLYAEHYRSVIAQGTA
jgi:glycosyltransferase involved in cell wall biosynthesis